MITFKRQQNGDYDVYSAGTMVGRIERMSSWDSHHRGPSAGGAGYDARIGLWTTSSQLLSDVKADIRKHLEAQP